MSSVHKRRTKKGIVYQVDDNLNKQIRLEVSASKESWKALRDLFIDNNKQFNEIFYAKFIFSAFVSSITKPPRGLHSKHWELEKRIGMIAPCVFSIVDYCLKKPRDKWPTSMGELVKEFAATESCYSHSGKPLPPKAVDLTAYLLEKAYEQDRDRIKRGSPPWTEDPDTFRRSYLTPNRKLIRIYQQHIKVFLDHPTEGLPDKLDLLSADFLRRDDQGFSLFTLFSQRYSLKKTIR